MPTSETATALQQAREGLTYESETDAPWEVFEWPDMTGEPTADGVKRKGKHKASAPVTEQSIDEFFGPLTRDKDWFGDEEKAVAAKYRSLLDTVKKQLVNPKVVKVGERKMTV
ncbi:MAG: Nuclease inhibitor-like protein [Gemmataceae bacterium]|nr:Nuclease inhibitor-like protein [Gemmataceae bacterium]